jgi:triphosphatase
MLIHVSSLPTRSCGVSSRVAVERYHPSMREGRNSDLAGSEVLSQAHQASDQREVEWQFDAFDLRPVERWIAPRMEAASPADGEAANAVVPTASNGAVLRPKPPRELVDTYLDTGDWRFHRAGYALRLRRHGRHVEATLKSLAPPSDGLRNRREITETLPADGLESLFASQGPVGARVRAVAGSHSVRPIFEIRTRRRPFAIAFNGATAGEIAMDETAVTAPDGGEPVRLQRVEVEVEGDSVDSLTPLVADLRLQCLLRPAELSKFEAGLLAAGLEPSPGPDLGPTTIDTTSSVGEVAFGVLRQHFGAYLAKEPGTRLGDDVEDLHDMRVASRRLRAALGLFADVLPVRAARLRSELGWVADALGAVRDLDVQREQLEAWIAKAEEPDREPLRSLDGVLEKERARARATMLRTLDSRRYERLVTSFTRFVRQGPTRSSRGARVPAVAAAPELISPRYDKVVKARKRVKREPSPERFHRLRIRCKRLRYALEFFADLYGAPARKPIRRLAALQDILGLMQDAAVAVDRLRKLATQERGFAPATVFAMGQVASRYQRKANRQRRRFPRAFRKFRGRSWHAFVSAMDDERSRAARAAWGAGAPADATAATSIRPVPSREL